MEVNIRQLQGPNDEGPEEAENIEGKHPIVPTQCLGAVPYLLEEVGFETTSPRQVHQGLQ